MRAMLLAAGIGSRLRPLTNTIPKCLVPIHGQPLLGIWLERLTAVGIGPFLINTHYLPEQVRSYVKQSKFAAKVKLVHEPSLLGTAGTLIANLDFFENEEGLLLHADNYCLADFEGFIHAHRTRPPECIMTMMTFRATVPSACGIVELNRKGVVIGWHEKTRNPPGNLANGAIYLLSIEAINLLRSDLMSAQGFSEEVVSQLVGRIYSYETDATFIDIGTPNNYDLANQ
jgi:mannose-1-phosphate guanylyltransferase